MYFKRAGTWSNRDSRWLSEIFSEHLRSLVGTGYEDTTLGCMPNSPWYRLGPNETYRGAYSLLFVSILGVCASKLCQGETYSLDDDEDMAIKEIQNLWIFEERNTDNMFTELPLEMCCRTGEYGRKYYQHQTLIILVKWDVVGFQEQFYWSILILLFSFLFWPSCNSTVFLGRADIEWRWAMYPLATGYLGPVAYAMAKISNKSWKRSRKHTAISLIWSFQVFFFKFWRVVQEINPPNFPNIEPLNSGSKVLIGGIETCIKKTATITTASNEEEAVDGLEPVIPTWSKPWDAVILGLKLP